MTREEEQVHIAVKAIFSDVIRIAPRVIDYRVISPFGPGPLEGVLVLYYVLASRQDFVIAVQADIVRELREMTIAELARYTDSAIRDVIVEEVATARPVTLGTDGIVVRRLRSARVVVDRHPQDHVRVLGHAGHQCLVERRRGAGRAAPCQTRLPSRNERRCSCSCETTTDPSPTAEATRFTEPHRMSPTAKSPGTVVS